MLHRQPGETFYRLKYVLLQAKVDGTDIVKEAAAAISLRNSSGEIAFRARWQQIYELRQRKRLKKGYPLV